MALPSEIAALIETFAANEADYTAPEFKEAQVRQQFIDPFFAALGWDVANTSGYAEAYKEVMHEDALKIGGETKAPDYSFRIGGNRKFFVEAKKPSVSLKDNPEPAYQLRRYSWSAKLPLGILTDFQEFAIYDTRVKPAAADKASVARLFYCRYDELEKNWDFIAGIFSKDAVLKGSFDKYAATTKGKRGTATVDDAFLEEIEKWRTLLARNLALRNPSLDTRGLNFAVQRTIDRIVFLRIAEDRGNEPFGQLQALLGAVSAKDNDDTLDEDPAAYGGGKPKRPPTIYPRLVQIFEKADYRYNSGLFHFAKDADCAETPDTLTPGLHIDDAVFKEILSSLYYPKSPYVFTVLPAYILGHVYEQFLGKVIRLTDGHRAEIEEKPEVRKAGGVYYTPQYIVDYIVQKTVGPLVDGKTPKQLETLAVLDPACGSGTFLLGAYDYLLKWYLDYYGANAPEKWAKQARIYETAPHAPVAASVSKPTRSWSLTTAERKRILLAHIHGVDIDSQAVEVTKLSLLLKVLEGERREFQGRTREMSAVLPDLSQNIQCGNSLIGHDFYQQPELPTLDAEAKYKLNTFEWKDGFPAVMKRGGFDAVIGNPPYGDLSGNDSRPHLLGKFAAIGGLPDFYALFIAQALRLLRPNRSLGYIIPSAWLGGPRYLSLRNFILKQCVREIVELPFNTFKDAYVDTLVLILDQSTPSSTHQTLTYSFPKKTVITDELPSFQPKQILQKKWSQSSDQKIVLDPGINDLLGRLRTSHPNTIANYAVMKRGVLFDPTLLTPKKSGRASLRYFEGDVYRYELNLECPHWVEFSDKMSERPREIDWFQGTRILLRRLVNRQQRLMAVLADQDFITNKNLYVLRPTATGHDHKWLLAVLNSRLISRLYLAQVSQATKDDFPQVTIKDVLGLPLHQPSPEIRAKLTSAADEMLALHRAQAAAQTPHEKDSLAKQITATDRQIDALVYQLYALTPEEIALIEGTANTQTVDS